MSDRLNLIFRIRQLDLHVPKLTVLMFLTLMVFTIIAAGARAWLAPTATTSKWSPATAQATPTPKRLSVLHVIVRPWGFEPKEVTRPKGEFALVVDNWSGLRQLDIHLIRETGERAQNRQISKEGKFDLSYYDLTPGRYLLTDTNHPNWVCRITITAK